MRKKRTVFAPTDAWRKFLPEKESPAGTKLDVMLKLFPRKQLWNVEKAKAFLEMLKQGVTLENCSTNLGIGRINIHLMKAELKRAAKAGYTIERYFKEDRPLKQGKQILHAGGSKKKEIL